MLFWKALDELPEELSLALTRARLDDAGILDCYPRDSNEVLASAGVTGSKSAVFLLWYGRRYGRGG